REVREHRLRVAPHHARRGEPRRPPQEGRRGADDGHRRGHGLRLLGGALVIAFVFPGQGSQAVGMGKELFDQFREAKAAFDEADDALSEKLSRLCFDGPEDALKLTANTQPAILATSAAVHAVFAARGPRPAFVAGHSLGEYSALVAAGAMPLSAAVKAVRARGTFMQEAVPQGVGAMAAVLGLSPEKVLEAC